MILASLGRLASVTFPISIQLAQLVVFDPVAAGLPLGPQPVVENGLAPLELLGEGDCPIFLRRN